MTRILKFEDFDSSQCRFRFTANGGDLASGHIDGEIHYTAHASGGTITSTNLDFTKQMLGKSIRISGLSYRYHGWRRLWRRIRYWRMPWMAYDDWEPDGVFQVSEIIDGSTVRYS